MERRRKRALRQLGDDDEDDEDNNDKDDDEETRSWPSDGVLSSLHEEEEVIGSIPASD
jgi:hypothetical protein